MLEPVAEHPVAGDVSHPDQAERRGETVVRQQAVARERCGETEGVHQIVGGRVATMPAVSQVVDRHTAGWLLPGAGL
jgi:hypothetical protein